MRRFAFLVSLVLLLPVQGCRYSAYTGLAVLAEDDLHAQSRIRSAIERELGRSPVAFGPSDPDQPSRFAALPPPPGPLEDRSLALPTMFRLELRGDRCGLVREDAGTWIPLEGVRCLAVAG
jgi:hypothetical protein